MFWLLGRVAEAPAAPSARVSFTPPPRLTQLAIYLTLDQRSKQLQSKTASPNPGAFNSRCIPQNEMATTSSPAMSSTAIIPAQVGFLAIFNPSLGNTDETLDDQIVYYSSVDALTLKRRRRTSRRTSSAAGRPTQNLSQAERNERLRQIGLAQGMVNFSRDFAGDQAVDTIETEKTRVVLHELEPGWWILAVRSMHPTLAATGRGCHTNPGRYEVHRPDASASPNSLEEVKGRCEFARGQI